MPERWYRWPLGKPATGTSMRFRLGAIVLIVLGVVLLLHNHGLMPQLGPLMHEWWPLILIVVGVALLFRRRS
jgi:antibiotic biosynthesis monooxygenase (ABM) superfamily enzyme